MSWRAIFAHTIGGISPQFTSNVAIFANDPKPSYRCIYVDVFVTSEFIHVYILCIVPQCLFWEVFVM